MRERFQLPRPEPEWESMTYLYLLLKHTWTCSMPYGLIAQNATGETGVVEGMGLTQ